MEPWRKSWREQIAPNYSTAGLERLLAALRSNDQRLIQGQIVVPKSFPNNAEKSLAVCACLVGFDRFSEPGALTTVGDVERSFQEFTKKCEVIGSGFSGGITFAINSMIYFTAWYDRCKRPEMLCSMIPEVERVLESRFPVAAGL